MKALVLCFTVLFLAASAHATSRLSLGAGAVRYDRVTNNKGEHEPKAIFQWSYGYQVSEHVDAGLAFHYSETPEIGSGLTSKSKFTSLAVEARYFVDSQIDGAFVGGKIGGLDLSTEIRSGGARVSQSAEQYLILSALGGYSFRLSDSFGLSPQFELTSVRSPEAMTLAALTLNLLFSW